MKIYRHGQWCDVDGAGEIFGTPAFQYGFGLFETLRVSRGRPLYIEDHLRRMLGSIADLDKDGDNPFTIGQLLIMVDSAFENYRDGEGVLKIIAYRKETAWDTVLITRPYPYSEEDYRRGFSLREARCARSAGSLLLRHKTMNYLENYLERAEAKRLGFDDAYFVNTEQVVTECTASNIFVVSGREFLTSPVEAGLLPGTMRARLLSIAPELGIRIQEQPISKEMLIKADKIILTNALIGAMPVRRIGDISYAIDNDLIKRLNTVLLYR